MSASASEALFFLRRSNLSPKCGGFSYCFALSVAGGREVNQNAPPGRAKAQATSRAESVPPRASEEQTRISRRPPHGLPARDLEAHAIDAVRAAVPSSLPPPSSLAPSSRRVRHEFSVSIFAPTDVHLSDRLSRMVPAMGGKIGMVFSAQEPIESILHHLRLAGAQDRIVLPWHLGAGVRAIDILMEFERAAVRRPILMPVKMALPSAVEAELLRRLPVSSVSRVLVVPQQDLELADARMSILQHFR